METLFFFKVLLFFSVLILLVSYVIIWVEWEECSGIHGALIWWL